MTSSNIFLSVRAKFANVVVLRAALSGVIVSLLIGGTSLVAMQVASPTTGGGLATGGSAAQPSAEDSRAAEEEVKQKIACLLYTSPSPRDKRQSRMPSSA